MRKIHLGFPAGAGAWCGITGKVDAVPASDREKITCKRCLGILDVWDKHRRTLEKLRQRRTRNEQES